MISAGAFLALSPRLYIRRPQPTEQYGQVLRVSVARASLYSRTSASTWVDENRNTPRLDALRPAALTALNWRNCRLVADNITVLLSIQVVTRLSYPSHCYHHWRIQM